MFIRLLLALLSLPLGATVFELQTLDQQIKEADGILIGHYLKSKSVRLDDGSIATQMFFKMNKEYGLQSDFFRMDEVIVHFPGGKIGEETVVVEGNPSFISGEHVALFIKTRSDRYWGLNLGMGSFKIINYGNEKMLINSIFPNDQHIGQIKLEDFEATVKKHKGTGLKVVINPEYLIEREDQTLNRLPASEVKEEKKRSIASQSNQEDNNQGYMSHKNFWLIFLLAAVGGLFRLLRQKVKR